MKNNICLLSIILLTALLAAGCLSGAEIGTGLESLQDPGDENDAGPGILSHPQESRYISLYYLNPTGDYLFPLSFSYDDNASADDLVSLLQAGPPRKEWGESPLPANLVLQSIEMEPGKVLVHIKPGGRMKDISLREEEVLIQALVYSLTSLDHVSQVEFLSAGEPPGEPFTLLGGKNLYSARDLVLNPLEEMEAGDPFLRLWLTCADVLYMVPVSMPREDLPQGTQDLALLLIQTLMAGPGESLGFLSPFPPETGVLGLKLQEGTLQVNFNREFKDNFAGGSAQEWALITSLVLTLTEIPGIQEVQILVDGRQEEAALGHMDTAEPLIRGVVNWVLAD